MTKPGFMKPVQFLLLPVCAAVVLWFSSLATFDVMFQIGELMIPDHTHVVQLPTQMIVGQIGLVLVAVGMVLATLSRKYGMLPRMAFLFAAVAFCLAALSIGFGTIQLESAFRSLATAMTVDRESFLQDVTVSKTPLILGWSCLLVATMMVFFAIAVPTKSNRFPTSSFGSRMSVALGTLSLLLILLAVVWNLGSLESLRESLNGNRIEPSAIAGGVTGMTHSVIVSLLAVFGWANVCILLAIRKERAEESSLS